MKRFKRKDLMALGELIQEVPNAIFYTKEKLVCDFCEQETGFVVDIKDVGQFCFNCSRAAIVRHFEANPTLDFVLIRGIRRRG